MSIDEYQLGQDLLKAVQSSNYGKQYQIKMIARNQLSPFRVYFYFQNEWWPAIVSLSEYPISKLSHPPVIFEQRIPPCPIHASSWHPNVFDNKSICWGTVTLFPNTRIIGLLNALYSMLVSPNHDSVVQGRCL